MYILGVETSCDETAAAVLAFGKDSAPRVLSNVVASQHEIHARFGGVVPELAARRHVEMIAPVLEAALEEASVPAEKSRRRGGHARPRPGGGPARGPLRGEGTGVWPGRSAHRCPSPGRARSLAVSAGGRRERSTSPVPASGLRGIGWAHGFLPRGRAFRGNAPGRHAG